MGKHTMAAVYPVSRNMHIPNEPVCLLYRKIQGSLYCTFGKLPCNAWAIPGLLEGQAERSDQGFPGVTSAGTSAGVAATASARADSSGDP